MDHELTLITTLAAALGTALVFGFLVARLKLPPLLGYLLAGVLIGPGTPGFVADVALSGQLAEMGVILLMFGVGLHFSLEELLSVRRIALPGAIAQIAVATALGAGLASLWGWSLGSGLVFGLALSVASTVVLLRALEDRGVLESVNGRIAVGWLIVEDLAMVLVLVILPALAGALGGEGAAQDSGDSGLVLTLLLTLAQVGVFIALMLVVGTRIFPKLLWQIARTGSRELFTLAIIAVAVGVAYGSAELFGVSLALGAFFGGMVLRGSALGYRAAEESLPLRDAFAVLFFVSIGMLFDPVILVNEPLRVLMVVATIVFGKSLAAFVIVLAFRYPLNTALTVSVSLAQIGEFSFILATMGLQLDLLSAEAQSLIVAGALISIALNPLLFRALEPAHRWFRSRSALAAALERRDDPLAEIPASVPPERLTGHTIIVGYGRVGSRIGEALLSRGVTFVVAEANRELVEELRKRGMLAVSGDAADAAVMVQTHVARARLLVIATPDASRAATMIEIARRLNPLIQVIARTHSDDEAGTLRRDHSATVFIGEHELALAMAKDVIERLAAVEQRTHGSTDLRV